MGVATSVEMNPEARSPALTGPRRLLSTSDVVFVIVGLVVGAGIFKAPALVAAHSAGSLQMLGLWVLGGLVALIGAVCYAELASSFPSTGGDYHFIRRAFGRGPAFLFAWARVAVMQTGSIALLAFVFGDYASRVLPLGPASSAWYAAAAIVVFTALNLRGLRQSARAQRLFTSLEVVGILLVAAAGFLLAAQAPEGAALADRLALADSSLQVAAAGAGGATDGEGGAAAALGLAMVFVLLTFSGWNEAAYVSAELEGPRRSIARALCIAVALITALYLLVNLAYLAGLGLEGMARSEALAADLAERAFGPAGAWLAGAVIAIAALTSINATIITGARCNHALGRDYRLFGFLAEWRDPRSTPANALLVQGAVALALVALGAATRSGFGTLVEFTAPVFWLFFVLTGFALFRLRRLEPDAPRPFRVPLYPLTPTLFCASGLYMLWSSLRYTGSGALVGVAVLLAGLPVLWLANRREREACAPASTPLDTQPERMPG